MEKDVTRQIEEQLSAFLDGELPEEELALLVRRLERDESHRATLDRYALIGATLRKETDVTAAVAMRRELAVAVGAEGSGSLASDSDAAPVAVVAQPGWPARYLLAASVMVAAVTILIVGGVGQQPGKAELAATMAGADDAGAAATTTVVDATAVRPVALVEDPELTERRERHQRELRRIRLNQERMRSYLISHGEHASPLHGGAISDSRMYVQQAGFSE